MNQREDNPPRRPRRLAEQVYNGSRCLQKKNPTAHWVSSSTVLRNIESHGLEKHQCDHRKQAFPGKVSGSTLLPFSLLVSVMFQYLTLSVST